MMPLSAMPALYGDAAFDAAAPDALFFSFRQLMLPLPFRFR